MTNAKRARAPANHTLRIVERPSDTDVARAMRNLEGAVQDCQCMADIVAHLFGETLGEADSNSRATSFRDDRMSEMHLFAAYQLRNMIDALRVDYFAALGDTTPREANPA